MSGTSQEDGSSVQQLVFNPAFETGLLLKSRLWESLRTHNLHKSCTPLYGSSRPRPIQKAPKLNKSATKRKWYSQGGKRPIRQTKAFTYVTVSQLF